VCKLYWNPLISRSAAADYFILILWIKQWRSASPGSNCLIVQHPRCGSPCSYPARRAFQHTISRSSSRLTSPSLTQASSPLVLTPENAHDNSPECDCYLISGPTPGYFQHHRCYYFHSIPSTPDNDYTIGPPLGTSSEELGTEPFTSAYLNTTTFRDN
jgi:hypothetical protein